MTTDIVHDLRDEIYFLTITLVMEAGGEPYEGILAVAYVISNRAKTSKASIIDTVLRAFQFSAWNTESGTRLNLDTIARETFFQCYKAACSGYFTLSDDPSKGATHYLNEELTRKIRGGNLPGWADPNKITAKIGNHTFYKVG